MGAPPAPLRVGPHSYGAPVLLLRLLLQYAPRAAPHDHRSSIGSSRGDRHARQLATRRSARTATLHTAIGTHGTERSVHGGPEGARPSRPPPGPRSAVETPRGDRHAR